MKQKKFMKKNIKKKFQKTILDFGDEWERFDNNEVSEKELKKIFNSYFRIFPKKFFNKKKLVSILVQDLVDGQNILYQK